MEEVKIEEENKTNAPEMVQEINKNLAQIN